MPDVSVAIIARDLESLNPKCLDSANKISKDVVIVTNATHAFKNYSDQKNYAVSKCKNDWILSLDADEELSQELIAEIGKLDFSFNAYTIPRLNYIFKKPIFHTNWGPKDDTHIWLFNRQFAKWIGDVHEEVKVAGTVGSLNHYKIHHSYTSVEEFISKMNHYTTLESSPSNPFWDFFRRYVLHLGFLDDMHGLFLSYLMFIYHTTAWVKKKFSS